jgi:hypothetical protein
MSGVVLVLAASLAILALLAFAVSVVGFLIQTSRHRPTRGWSVPPGGSWRIGRRVVHLTA